MKLRQSTPTPTLGTAANDFLTGTLSNEFLIGNGGRDTIYGGGGDDIIESSPTYENNSTKFDPIGDLLDGGIGNDSLYGADGNDTLVGGADDDLLAGFGGNDSIAGGDGHDTLSGGDGDDTLEGGGGFNIVDGDDGNDLLRGGSVVDKLDGGNGNDTLEGGTGAGILIGGAGDDLFLINSRYTVLGNDNQVGDRVIVNADWVKTSGTGATWSWAAGVEKLPYWVDSLVQSYASTLPIALSDTVIKYCFVQTPPTSFRDKDKLGFTPFTADQIAYTRKALAYISSVVDVRFEETTAADGDYTIDLANNTQTDSGGYASMIGTYGPSALMLATDSRAMAPSRDDGASLYYVLMHELGHALGLKHPFSHVDSLGHTGAGPFLPDAEDQRSDTVMSYTDNGDEATDASYAPLDLAALQYVWGVAQGAHAGDTLYRLSETSTNMLYDGSGNDTVDASALQQNVVLDLRPGHWSYIGKKAELITAAGQITVNFGTVLENANGGNGNDILTGNDVANTIDGGAGNDFIGGGKGDDRIEGGTGLDTAIFNGKRADYQVTLTDGKVQVRDKVSGEGTDLLSGIERLQFSDRNVAIDINVDNGSATIFRLYQAAFDRKPDLEGLGFWLKAVDGGMSITEIAHGFMQSPEFIKLYGAGADDTTFLKHMYTNTLHREYDAGGLIFWQDALHSGTTRERTLCYFADSKENIANVAEVIGVGYDYLPYQG
jgi:serralysin